MHDWTPHPDNDSRVIHDTDRLSICTTAPPRRLPTNYGNFLIQALKTKITKLSPIHKIHCRGRSPKKADFNSGATGLPVPTGGPVDRIWSVFRARYYVALI